MRPCLLTALVGLPVWVSAQGVADEAGKGPNLVRDVPGLRPSVSVDSTYRGYGIEVLSDGTWIERGKEFTQEYSHPDRLGNCGNSWVSAPDTGTGHWIRIDWPKPVTANQVEIWWTIPKWMRHFRRTPTSISRSKTSRSSTSTAGNSPSAVSARGGSRPSACGPRGLPRPKARA